MPSEDHARKSDVTAEVAFSDYLSRRDQDESVDFESFCREHPELEGSLRALHSRHVEDAAPSGDQIVSATEAKVDLGVDRLVREVPEVEGWKILDPCVVHARIGQGGMGVVYRARHLTLNIDVAVKILLPELAERAPQFVQRFHREAELTAALNHANLVRVYHCDERYGLHYLVMELVEGESVLERVVRRGRRSGGKGLGAGESASILLEAARGLAEAHRKGIVHRDIKPSNILVASDGRVKVTDLGLGRSPLSDVLTAEGVLGGTPAYMPPEQWENLSQVGAPADVWALGATFDFLLRGRSVCAAQSPVDIMRRITSQEFPDIRDEVSSVPEDLARILRRCTARDPAARYADASELVEALAESIRCLGFEESLADPEGVTPTSPHLAVPAPSAALLERLRERVRDGTHSSSTSLSAARSCASLSLEDSCWRYHPSRIRSHDATASTARMVRLPKIEASVMVFTERRIAVDVSRVEGRAQSSRSIRGRKIGLRALRDASSPPVGAPCYGSRCPSDCPAGRSGPVGGGRTRALRRCTRSPAGCR